MFVQVDLGLNFGYVGYSAEYPKSKLTVELDTAHATWVAHDVALISTKTGMLLYLSLVYEGRSASCPHLYVYPISYLFLFTFLQGLSLDFDGAGPCND